LPFEISKAACVTRAHPGNDDPEECASACRTTSEAMLPGYCEATTKGREYRRGLVTAEDESACREEQDRCLRGAAPSSSAQRDACKVAGGPTGGGHVKTTFTPSGAVWSAVVDGGPFPGHAVGGCIAGKFRSARVPAFGGGPVSVGKSFRIN
jgi:hypothetical protein